MAAPPTPAQLTCHAVSLPGSGQVVLLAVMRLSQLKEVLQPEELTDALPDGAARHQPVAGVIHQQELVHVVRHLQPEDRDRRAGRETGDTHSDGCDGQTDGRTGEGTDQCGRQTGVCRQTGVKRRQVWQTDRWAQALTLGGG